jgi:CubicO group peptidase (beta-lactamase class C family)
MHRPSSRQLAAAAAAIALLVLALGTVVWSGRLGPLLRGERGAGEEPRELLAGGNAAPAPRVTPELESLDPAGLEAAAAYAGQHDSRALIVSRHDHIVFERYWHGTGFDTPADAQSFTRLLPALATGVAMSHRLIGWPDEPVSAFLGEWRADPRGALTVRNLLQMTSGLARPAGLERTADLAGLLLRTPLATAPGLRRTEQAADPQLLALVVERAARERFAGYVARALWRRLGAADAWLRLDRPGGLPHADCCMLAHQGDWIRIGQLLLRDGNYRGAEVIRPGWVRLMRTPTVADPDYGAYVRLAADRASGDEPFAANDMFVVEGAGGNRLWIVPSLQLAILCTGVPAGRDAAWSDSRVPNLIIRAARDYAPAARPNVSALVPGH